MEIYQGIILGIVQGLTEFLPVSSSGHLVLGQIYFGITESGLAFDIAVHMGTLGAVLVVYQKDIAAMFASLVRYAGTREVAGDENLIMTACILAGSVPTALIGFGLKQFEEVLFSSAALVGFMLLVTGTLLWISKGFYKKVQGGLTLKRALVIGVVQGLAVIPGISRSGSTIAAGMFAGLDRAKAARFSFLLSLPAIVGAELLSIKDALETGVTGVLFAPATICGTIASFIVGLAALKLLIRLVHQGRFHLFAPYCWVAGALVLLSTLI